MVENQWRDVVSINDAFLAQLLVDIACTVDYFNEQCEIASLTKEYIQVDHVLLIEHGLSPPKIFVKIPRQESVPARSSPAPLRKIQITKPNKEWITEFREFNDSHDGSESKCIGQKRAAAVITKEMENDMSEIKKLLHTEIKENRQHKQIYVDLHNSVQSKIDEIGRKVSLFADFHEEKEVVQEYSVSEEIEECAEDSNLGIDSFSIEKSYVEAPQKPTDKHEFDLNSVSEFFPLTNNSEIIAFENKVRRDNDFKEKMIKTLYQVGGENARVACRKLAKLMFIDEILVEYSYEGAQSKKKFKDFTEIIEIIFLAVYNRFNDYTMEQHKSGLSDHLRYASSRLKKRKNAILMKLDSGSKKTKYDEMEIGSIGYSQ